jgi:hypothetical protein
MTDDQIHELTKDKAIRLKSDGDQRFALFHQNGVIMGLIARDCDLYYNFWPRLSGGFWPGHMLKEIADVLEALNKPIEKEYDDWCAKETEKMRETQRSQASS